MKIKVKEKEISPEFQYRENALVPKKTKIKFKPSEELKFFLNLFGLIWFVVGLMGGVMLIDTYLILGILLLLFPATVILVGAFHFLKFIFTEIKSSFIREEVE